MDSLKTRWKTFLGIIFDPWTLCFIVATGFLVFKSLTQSNPSVSSTTLFTILITMASAILGGRISKQWVDITEGGILVARGKSAVRSLKLLLSTITSLDKRVDQYLIHAEIKNSEVAKLSLGEIKERCNHLAEEAVSSIENWTDIIPEADVKTHIGLISDIKFNYDKTAKELHSLKTELQQTKNKSKEELDGLKKAVQEKDEELFEMQRELRKKEAAFGIGFDPSSGTYKGISEMLSNITLEPSSNIYYTLPGGENITIKNTGKFVASDETKEDDE